MTKTTLIPETTTQQLKSLISLEMAETIADLHSYPGGIIVHDDIQLSQFLFTDDGHLKVCLSYHSVSMLLVVSRCAYS